MMNPEGRIAITLTPDGQRFRVAIHSSRPLHAAQIFHGKSIAETLQGLPLLFTVCGVAQAAAATQACEQALGVSITENVISIRQQLVSMETIREHLWQALLGWSQWLQLSTPEQVLSEVMALQQQLRTTLTQDHSPFQINPSLAPQKSASEIQHALLQILQQELFGISTEQWLALKTLDDLRLWSNQHSTIAARTVRQLESKQWRSIGACDHKPLPTLDLSTLNQAMKQRPAFVHKPEWDGSPHESSPLTRTQSPLLKQLQQYDGNGLLTRCIARLTELAQQVVELGEPTPPEKTPALQPGLGFGTAQAARGQLIHRVEIDGLHIARYQILAPTEWNFHPQGVVAQALRQLDPTNPDYREQAHRIIHAVDPCVGYDLKIAENGVNP